MTEKQITREEARAYSPELADWLDNNKEMTKDCVFYWDDIKMAVVADNFYYNVVVKNRVVMGGVVSLNEGVA